MQCFLIGFSLKSNYILIKIWSKARTDSWETYFFNVDWGILVVVSQNTFSKLCNEDNQSDMPSQIVGTVTLTIKIQMCQLLQIVWDWRTGQKKTGDFSVSSWGYFTGRGEPWHITSQQASNHLCCWSLLRSPFLLQLPLLSVPLHTLLLVSNLGQCCLSRWWVLCRNTEQRQ